MLTKTELEVLVAARVKELKEDLARKLGPGGSCTITSGERSATIHGKPGATPRPCGTEEWCEKGKFGQPLEEKGGS